MERTVKVSVGLVAIPGCFLMKGPIIFTHSH
jgi:hypothetical protein